LDIFLGIPDLQHVDVIAEALSFDILPPERPWRPYSIEKTRGVFCRMADWVCLDADGRQGLGKGGPVEALDG
jgi:hypothetical protein